MSILLKPAHPTRQAQGKHLITASLIHSLRGFPAFMRSIATLVLVTFTLMILQPTIAAAQVAKHARPTPASMPEHNLLDELRITALRVKAKSERGEKRDDDEQRLLQHADALDEEERQTEADFQAVEQHLDAHGLPEEIKERHRQTVADYRAKMNELKTRLGEFRKAHGKKTPGREQRALTDLADFLQKEQKARPHQSVDPDNLPFRTPDSKVRAPKEKKEDLDEIVRFNKPVQVAAAELTPEMLAQADLLPNAAPAPDDLAENEDVQITQAIRDQAAALHHNPVEIYSWVRNSVEFLPTYGSIQGSDVTLQTKRGNAFDTASLLIALLRASSIPARYAYGTIRVPADQVMNWVGGVKTPEAAQSLLGQGGIPNVALVSGGKITAFKLEHVWVEAFVDFIPSRGAIHRTGDTWVPLDASFKQYTYKDGMDLKNAVPSDVQSLIDQIQTGATVNEAEGWVQNIDQNLIQQALTDYQSQIKTYIDGQKPEATVSDVIGTKRIAEQKSPFLAGTLPYTLLVSGPKTAVLSNALRHKVRLTLYGSSLDRSLDSPAVTYSASLPSLAGKRLSFTYDPASSADQAVIDDAVANYRNSLPAYLIQVKPVLKAEGEVLASGGSYAMGEKHILSVDIIAPWYQHNRDYQVTAGDFFALGLNPAGITADLFNARAHQHDLNNTTGPDFAAYTAEMFHQIALAWWAEKFAFNDIIGITNRVIHYQLPSHVLAGSPLNVRYFFGIPRSANYGSRVMDAKEDLIMAAPADGNAESQRRFVLAAGYVGSYLEAGIFDQAFLLDPGHSMSTITALKAANERGVAIYTIDQNNVAALAQIQTDPEDLQDMQNAVAAGLRVTTAQHDITVDNFTGLGYILEDPQTGAAAYLISGGRNGGNSPSGQFVYPMPQPVATPIHNFMLSFTLRNAGASLAFQNGIVSGIVLPETAASTTVAGGSVAGGAFGPLAAAIITALVIYSSHAQEIENRYPKTNRVLRHFTRAQFGPLIWASKMIYASPPGGDYNKDFYAVYLADPMDQIDAQAKASCPPTADESIQLTSSYNLALNDGESPEKRARAYVDIELTREDYWRPVMREVRNDNDATEVVFKLQLLYFGPYSIGIDGLGEC